MNEQCVIPKCGQSAVWKSQNGAMCHKHYQLLSDSVVEDAVVSEARSYFGRAMLEYPKTNKNTIQFTIAPVTCGVPPNVAIVASLAVVEIAKLVRAHQLSKRDTVTTINIMERILYLASERAMSDAISEN